MADQDLRRTKSPARDDRKPAAEFRDRGEVLDKHRFGEILEGIGISKSHKVAPPPISDEMPPDDELISTADADDEEHDEEHDEDDEEEHDFVPPFSLVERMKEEDSRGPRDRNVLPCVEVLDIKGEALAGVTLLRPGDGYWIGPELGMFMRAWARELPPRERLLKYRRDGLCRLEMRKDIDGTVNRGGKDLRLSAVPELKKNRRRGTVCMDVKDGEAIDIVDGSHTYHISFVSQPAEMKDPRPFAKRVQPDKQSLRSLIASIAGHILIAVILTIVSSSEAVSLPKEKSRAEPRYTS